MSDDPDGPGARVVETHISLLFFVADRVYKMRKPVRFGFLDFTDRAVREVDCHREVELNRRIAGDVYLGVADLVLDGTAIDHAVVMRALPESRRLATMVRTDDVPEGQAAPIDAVAATVAAFHAGALRSATIAESATAAALETEWEDNFREVRRFVGTVLAPDVDAEIHSLVRGWLHRHGGLLEERISAGWICDGHGDLQAEDIFCLDDGVRVLDCIEFSDVLRYGDVCADVAFLAMDLERLGRADLATRFVRRYEECAGARFPPTLLHHYIAQRSYVRAKVACLREEQGAEEAGAAARWLHACALRHLRLARPVAVLVGGLPGSGKSTLARAMAGETGWALLRSDEVRRDQPVDQDRYGTQGVARVYAELLRRARALLERGEPVILDASWVSAVQRAEAARVVDECTGALVELCCTCEDDVATRRLLERHERGQDFSEATDDVRRLLAARMDPWPTAELIDTTEGATARYLAVALELVGQERA